MPSTPPQLGGPSYGMAPAREQSPDAFKGPGDPRVWMISMGLRGQPGSSPSVTEEKVSGCPGLRGSGTTM